MVNDTSASQSADVAFVGGAVYRVNAARAWAQAVAVAGDTIVAVGSDDDIRPLVTSRTTVVNLHGRMLLPGFQDAHVHASGGGLDRLRCDLTVVHGRAEYLRHVASYAAARPGEAWILGSGWYMDAFPGGIPRSADLDEVTGDRPAFLVNRDHHGAWANSAAMRRAGIDDSTPDPPDGRIERDEAGHPVGTLQEGAMRLVEAVISAPTLDQRIDGVLEGQRYLHGMGITAWQEAIVGEYPGVPDCYEAYRQVAADGRLTGRVVGALWWDRTRGEYEVEEQIAELAARRASAEQGQFRAGTVKIMQDGVCENFTAAMLTPYLGAHGETGPGQAQHSHGLSYLEPALLHRVVQRLDALGFQVHIHAIGDRAVRDALNAFAVAGAANGRRGLRHHIAHLQIVHPEDTARFRQLDVTANVQPLWACYDKQMTELTLPFLGRERAAWQYPFGSLARNGAQLAFGSDWPVSSPNPLWLLHVAVNRIAPWDTSAEPDPRSRESFLPAERLDLPTAISAATAGSAYVNHLDDTGSIEVGYRADLAVLDRNLFEHPETEIGEAAVDLTMAGGHIVYTRPSFSG
ncbi:MAG TPA: amidohydrolase [Streptosporangiaceae bacterium]|nr:amidohydrolase [Streptosporangiaceae bacterium]